MFLSLFNSSKNISNSNAPTRASSYNHSLVKALRNLKNLGKPEELLVNQEKIRTGSLSQVAWSSKDDLSKALDYLERLGEFRHIPRAVIVQRLLELLESKEYKKALASKTRHEIELAAEHFRTIGADLAKIVPEPSGHDSELSLAA